MEPNFEEIVQCAVCGRCRAPQDFPAGRTMCYMCDMAEIRWTSAWFMDADELGVPVQMTQSFRASQGLLCQLLVEYFGKLHFPFTRFAFEGDMFETDYAEPYAFRCKARGFRMNFHPGRDIPCDADRTIRLLCRETLTRAITAVQSLDEDTVEAMEPLDVGVLYFAEIGNYLELTYLAGTVDDEELRQHLHEIMGVICGTR